MQGTSRGSGDLTPLQRYSRCILQLQPIRQIIRFTSKLISLGKVWTSAAKCLILQLPYLTNPSGRAGYDTRSIFKRSLIGMNSEFSFSQTSCLSKAEEPSLPYYLPLAGGRIIGFIPFPRVLVLCEMQSVSSRFWTRVAVSISYDDNHYTTGTSCNRTITVFQQRWP